MVNFPHGHAYSASLYYPMSLKDFDPVCPQAILAMSVALFPSGTLCVTNIPSIICSNIVFCSELNGELAGESYVATMYSFLI